MVFSSRDKSEYVVLENIIPGIFNLLPRVSDLARVKFLTDCICFNARSISCLLFKSGFTSIAKSTPSASITEKLLSSLTVNGCSGFNTRQSIDALRFPLLSTTLPLAILNGKGKYFSSSFYYAFPSV